MNVRNAMGYCWRKWIRPAGIFFIILAPLKSAVIDWNWVPTGSMKPTILEGDLVLINKLAYSLRMPFTSVHVERWGHPERGDIAVFLSPEDDTRLVKRVIGLPGDILEMRNEILFVNGVRQTYTVTELGDLTRDVYESGAPLLATEHLASGDHPILVFPDRAALRSFGPITVPTGHLFMLGDSRDNSRDSRFFGAVSEDRVLGRANRVLLSVDLKRYLMPRILRTGRSLE